MSIAANLIRMVEGQKDSWTDENPLMPNDAIALVRWNNLRVVAQLIEVAVTKTGKDVKTVITKAIAGNKDKINTAYPYIGSALDFIIDQHK